MNDDKHFQTEPSVDIGNAKDEDNADSYVPPPTTAIKRDLRRRHINMISIAGMIVGSGV
jgi:amino acid permease